MLSSYKNIVSSSEIVLFSSQMILCLLIIFPPQQSLPTSFLSIIILTIFKFNNRWTHSCGFERKSFRINTATCIIFSCRRGCNSSLKKLKLLRFFEFWPWVVVDRAGITSWLPNYVAGTVHVRQIPFFQKCCLQNLLHRSTCSSDNPSPTRIRIIQSITKVFNYFLT